MTIQYYSWSIFKSDIVNKGFLINYKTTASGYRVFIVDRNIIWECFIKSESDISDFEDNYKDNCNKCLYDVEGKQYLRSESRPINCTTYFTSKGDTIGENQSIGTGNRLEWDASISEDWTTDGCPSGFKKKVTIIRFIDSIWIKDGTIYYVDAEKGSYIDMEVLCPNGGYYMYMGQLQQNLTGDDLSVDHYINNMPIQGNVPMGDELNTETCSQELPNYLKYRFTVTIPESDVTSYGYGLFEIYRQRTIVL